ncbi:MAG: hypothetical protein OEY94_01955 [Alphaproteobacteria bacterium]|nr:hypothetical protein [Alphaproteobacteria bacterium]
MRYNFCKLLSALALFVLISNQALAQEETKKQSYQAAPYCQFTISFPEAPEIRRVCEEGDQSMCYDLISFIKVFDMASTVRVDIICNPSNEKLYNHLTTDEMRRTVREMSKESVVEAFEINAREEEEYRQAALVGKGRAGMEDTILLAQLWSGKTSLMSVEAELSGIQMDEADQLFASILRSISFIGDLEAQSKEETPATVEEETPAAK